LILDNALALFGDFSVNQEMRKTALQWIQRFIFPDFTNKLTWTVALAGIAIASAPIDIAIASLNWLAAYLNQSLNIQPKLPYLSGSSDPMGYWFVFAALAHNVANKIIIHRVSTLDHQIQIDKREMDRRLFEEFNLLLPSNSDAISLVKEHHFGNSFLISDTSPIAVFVRIWDKAEYEFIDQTIETEKEKLHDIATSFLLNVARYTAPNNGMQTVMPRHVNPDDGLPDHIVKEIEELDGSASALYDQHQRFIRTARGRL
jgi:hypothetical protein